MLSRDERDRLQEMELQFAEDDPQLVQRFKQESLRSIAYRNGGWVLFALAMVVMSAGAGLYGAITVILITIFVLALRPVWRAYFMWLR